jgi:hypothetical protein
MKFYNLTKMNVKVGDTVFPEFLRVPLPPETIKFITRTRSDIIVADFQQYNKFGLYIDTYTRRYSLISVYMIIINKFGRIYTHEIL